MRQSVKLHGKARGSLLKLGGWWTVHACLRAGVDLSIWMSEATDFKPQFHRTRLTYLLAYLHYYYYYYYYYHSHYHYPTMYASRQ